MASCTPKVCLPQFQMGTLSGGGPLLFALPGGFLNRPSVLRTSKSNGNLYGPGSTVCKGTLPRSSITVKPAPEEDYWAAADLHCEAFYPNAGILMALFIKLDRTISIVDGNKFEKMKRGRFVCLIATVENNSTLPEPPFPLSIINGLFPRSVGRGMGATHQMQGILGVMAMDDTGQHLPSIYHKSNGEHVWKRQKGCAYLSNLAVSPENRGQGIGKQIVQEAERIARDWGCWCCALHCDLENSAAVALYTGLGYLNPKDAPGNFRTLSQGHRRVTHDVLLVKLL